MADLGTRELERRARRSGRPEDRLTWLRAWGRSGGLPPSHLVLEALLGDAEARRLLGWGSDVDVAGAATLLAHDRAWCAWLAAHALEEVVGLCPALAGPAGRPARRALAWARVAARHPSRLAVDRVRAVLDGLPACSARQGECCVHRGLAQIGLALSDGGEDDEWRTRAGAAAGAVALALAARAAGSGRLRLSERLRACAG